MKRASRSARTFVGVAGVQYLTRETLGSAEEQVLQDVQFALSCVRYPGEKEPVPHLFKEHQAVVGESRPQTVMGLWVPVEKQVDAERLLEQAGYEVADSA
jgi:hypothetical protein